MRWAVFAVLLAARPAMAQDSSALRLRLSVADRVEAGRRAPAIVLPYATLDSIGPAAQPFDLAKELGHVVVLLVYKPSAASVQDWSAVAKQWTAPFPDDVVIAGLAAQAPAELVLLARSAAAPFKFLSDIRGAVIRHYGTPRAGAMLAVIIDRDGTVRYVNDGFLPRQPASYGPVTAAIAAARRR
jgi:peroxiredoxin